MNETHEVRTGGHGFFSGRHFTGSLQECEQFVATEELAGHAEKGEYEIFPIVEN